MSYLVTPLFFFLHTKQFTIFQTCVFTVLNSDTAIYDYILDTVVAALRRMAAGHNPFSADRGHFHHRLVDMGFSHKEAVSLLYAISGLLGLVAVMYTMGTTSGSGRKNALVIAVAALVILLLIFNCMRKPSTRILSGLAEHVSEIEIEARAEERAIMEKEQAEAERLKKEQKLEQKKHKNQH